MNLHEFMRQRAEARWNALIPKRAVVIEILAAGVRWLHPTKGWRYVSNKRLLLEGVRL